MRKNADEFRCGLGSLDTQRWKWLFSTSHKSIYFLKEVHGKPRIKRAQSASTTGCFACSDGELYVSVNLWSGNPVQVSSPLRWPGFWNAAMHPPTFKKLGSSWRGQECIWHRSGRFCWHRMAASLVSVMFWDNVRQETLFVFFAEARSATSDAKPPCAKCGICRLAVHLRKAWRIFDSCEEVMYIYVHRILLHTKPLSQLGRIGTFWHLKYPEFARKPTSSYYEHI